MEKVVIVGSGMTGATIAAQLKKSLSPPSLKILDKGRGAGGRMSTARSKGDGRHHTVDLGAQYFSITSEYAEKNKSFHEELFAADILKRFNGKLEGQRAKDGSSDHYVAPNGSNKVVKYFLEQSEAELMSDERISHIDVKDGKIYLTSEDNSHECDALVLTMPVPQILNLEGDIKNIIESQPEVKKKLEEVSYSTRFCVGLFFNQKAKIDIPWDVKYYTDDPIIRYVSIDPRKRGNVDPSLGLSACVHSSVPFSLHYKNDPKQRIGMYLLQRLRQIEPSLPIPDEIKSHKWLYSQVHKGYPESPGCVVLSNDPPIILAGDAFTCSTMDGCIESAVAVNDTLVKIAGKL
ncbi:hypothetical protein FSP39_012396 [Pinctada imbricata]|uniref:Amine oxidase domain-containing protein n=1 Tax=Pinctada imbricata TaxID=66713 RepID=A0AA88Y6S1_PINIB|nr:hypothetical protein FSP39_012396 [Pinctada imbricata]